MQAVDLSVNLGGIRMKNPVAVAVIPRVYSLLSVQSVYNSTRKRVENETEKRVFG